MYLINTSFVIPLDKETRWCETTRQQLGQLLKNHQVTEFVLSKVLNNNNEGFATYSLLLDTEDLSIYDLLSNEIIPGIVRIYETDAPEDNIHYFITVMKKMLTP